MDNFLYRIELSGAALFNSIAFLYSRSNSRNTEDCTHALWNLVVSGLCKGRPNHLLPTPQYHLWIAKNEPQDFLPSSNQRPSYDQGYTDDLSFTTNAESGIIEVIPDYVVLMPRVAFRSPNVDWLGPAPRGAKSPGTTLEAAWGFLKGLLFTFPQWPCTRVPQLSIPLIVELKRPVSRNPKTINSHINHIQMRTEEAVSQAEAQGLCLFMAGKFSHQEEVVLIAATADYWRFRVMTRTQVVKSRKVFVKNEYLGLKGVKFREVDAVDDSEFQSNVVPYIEDSDTEVLSSREIRSRQKDHADANREAGQSNTYSIAEINKLKDLNERTQAVKKLRRATFNNSEDWIASSPIKLDKGIVGCKNWSPIFQIGTEASHVALEYISQRLNRLADAVYEDDEDL